MYRKIDTDNKGFVTLDDWHSWLKKTHDEKGAKGEKWLGTILHTMKRGLEKAAAADAADPAGTVGEPETEEDVWQALMDEAEVVFLEMVPSC